MHSFVQVGDLLSWGYAAAGPGEDDGGDAARIQQAFSNSQVYLGGFYAPNRIARQPVMIMHGQGGLPDCLEILPGIYIGGGVATYRARSHYSFCACCTRTEAYSCTVVFRSRCPCPGKGSQVHACGGAGLLSK